MRLVTLVVVLALGAGVALAQPTDGPKPARVVLDEARLERIEPRREVSGELRAIRRSIIASEQPGLVVDMTVEQGDAVGQGDRIASLDDTFVRLDLAQAQSRLVSAQALVEVGEAQQRRAKRDEKSILALGEASSEKETLDARSAVVVAKGQLASVRADLLIAQSQVRVAQERLDDMVVRAPFTGVVVRKLTEIGQWVGLGDPVAEMIDTSRVDAWLDVPESLITRLELQGVEAQIRLIATGEVFSAPVSAIVPQADELARLFPVRVRLDNPDGRLKPGMSVVGLAPTGRREDMLTIHKDALLRDDGGAYVYFDANGAASAARVKVLFAVGDRLAITSRTLKAGAGVVVEGNERLFPGQSLEILRHRDAPALSSRGS